MRRLPLTPSTTRRLKRASTKLYTIIRSLRLDIVLALPVLVKYDSGPLLRVHHFTNRRTQNLVFDASLPFDFMVYSCNWWSTTPESLIGLCLATNALTLGPNVTSYP